MAEAYANMPSAQKIAFLLVGLGPETAGVLLRELDPADRAAILHWIEATEAASLNLVQESALEFQYYLKKRTEHTASSNAEEMAARKKEARESTEDLIKELESMVKNIPTQEISEYLMRQPPETVAVILSRLQQGDGASVLERFPKDFLTQVIEIWQTTNPVLAANMKNHLFIKEKLHGLSEDSISKLAANVQILDLVLALEPADEGLKARFFKYTEEKDLEAAKQTIAEIGPITPFTIESAQNKIAHKLEELHEVA